MIAEPPSRILMIRPSALGDVCRSVPVLVSLRRAFPAAEIDWVVQDDFAPIIAAHPDLHAAIPFSRRRLARWWRSPAVARELVEWLGALRRRRYDLVFDCQGLSRSAVIARATGARRRVGHRDARELAWLGYNVRHERRPGRHAVDEMLDLLRAEGIDPVYDFRLYVADPDAAWWEETRARHGLSDARYAVLAPTARWSTKRWPLDRWPTLVEPLFERGMERVVVTGAPNERDQVPAWDDERVVDLVGATTIGQTMALVAGAGLVVANDSAPLHMAVGFDRPCVALFGPTDPAIAGPYGRPEAVVRAPGAPAGLNHRRRGVGEDLMRRIPVEAVLARIDDVLGGGSRAARGVVA